MGYYKTREFQVLSCRPSCVFVFWVSKYIIEWINISLIHACPPPCLISGLAIFQVERWGISVYILVKIKICFQLYKIQQNAGPANICLKDFTDTQCLNTTSQWLYNVPNWYMRCTGIFWMGFGCSKSGVPKMLCSHLMKAERYEKINLSKRILVLCSPLENFPWTVKGPKWQQIKHRLNCNQLSTNWSSGYTCSVSLILSCVFLMENNILKIKTMEMVFTLWKQVTLGASCYWEVVLSHSPFYFTIWGFTDEDVWKDGGWRTLIGRIVLINKSISLLHPSRGLTIYRHWSTSILQLHVK